MEEINYKKRKRQSLRDFEKEIIKFTEKYFYEKVKELGIKADLTLITSNNKHKILDLLNYTETMNLSRLGTCDEFNKVEINISNYIVRSVYLEDQEYNFALLLETINHELSHACDNSKKKELITDDYKIIKYFMMLETAPEMYTYYYKNLEGEQKAFQTGCEKTVEELKDIKKFKRIIPIYEDKLKKIKLIKATKLYDEANTAAIDKVIRENYNNKFFIDNYDYLKYEYNEDGKKKSIEEIMDTKDNIISEDLFNHISYNSFITDDESNVNDISETLNYGIDYENNRLEINEVNAITKLEYKENKEYILKRLYKINKELKGDIEDEQFFRGKK